MRPNDADMSQVPPPLLKSLARIGSLGINLFTESDGRLTNQIAATLGHNLVSLRLRACSFSADALLECLVRATRLDSLSLMACNRAQGADGRGGADAAVLDSVLTRLPADALPALSSLDLDEDQVWVVECRASICVSMWARGCVSLFLHMHMHMHMCMTMFLHQFVHQDLSTRVHGQG